MAGGRSLRRSRDKRMLAGVLGGLAEYFDIDVTLTRVIFVIVTMVSAAFRGSTRRMESSRRQRVSG